MQNNKKKCCKKMVIDFPDCFYRFEVLFDSVIKEKHEILEHSYSDVPT